MEEQISILEKYGVNFTEKEYITNPAIGRDEEIKRMIIVLLTPDKSAILTGKPGIGKTAIVEGLAYRIQQKQVPDALLGYTIIKVDVQALLGTVSDTGDTRIQRLVDELATKEKYILFVDEIHTLIGATSETALDLANMFKTGLGRGDIKVVGATTSDEYERYILRDKAFVRRFQRIDVKEPTQEETVKILMGTYPKIEKKTGAILPYTDFIKERICKFIVGLTEEYNRVYETSNRYPDIALTLLGQAFSTAVFDNRNMVMMKDIKDAISNSKAIYPDVIKKNLPKFDEEFKDEIMIEKGYDQ